MALLRYCVHKLFSAVPVLLGISLFAFILGVISPGDPAEIALSQDGYSSPTPEQVLDMRARLGLDLPLPRQYLNWLGRVARGDLGTSYANNLAVAGELSRRFPMTLELACCALILVYLFGLAGGILAAAYKDRPADRAIKVVLSLIMSFPDFWLAILLVFVFVEKLKLLPSSGFGGIEHLILPSLVLSCAAAATIARLLRGTLSAEFGQQYYLAAKAKGLSRRRLLLAHALPNGVLPVVSYFGNYLGAVLGGSVIVESLFAIPGVGCYALAAISNRDYPALQGYVLLTGTLYVSTTAIVDILNSILDPRIRLTGGAA